MNNTPMHDIKRKFKDSTVIFIVVHYEYECVELTLLNILSIIEAMEDTYLVIINSKASPRIEALLNRIHSDKVDMVHLPINFGYNHGINYYIRDFISDENLPQCIVSLGADILFNQADFGTLVDAIMNLEKYGTISLSYENNQCNPERNVLKAKDVVGKNGKKYPIRHTFLCPVAGGIMGIRGEILRDTLNYKLFHPKYFPKQYLDISPVGGADSALYNAIKRKYKVGYIANTTALHMKSRDGLIVDISDAWDGYIKDIREKSTHLVRA